MSFNMFAAEHDFVYPDDFQDLTIWPEGGFYWIGDWDNWPDVDYDTIWQECTCWQMEVANAWAYTSGLVDLMQEDIGGMCTRRCTEKWDELVAADEAEAAAAEQAANIASKIKNQSNGWSNQTKKWLKNKFN